MESSIRRISGGRLAASIRKCNLPWKRAIYFVMLFRTTEYSDQSHPGCDISIELVVVERGKQGATDSHYTGNNYAAFRRLLFEL